MAISSSKLLFFLILPMSFFILSTHPENLHPHPLDPLTPSELQLVQTLITPHISNSFNFNCTFHYIGLEDPHKPTLLTFLSTQNPKTLTPSPRRAFVIARINQTTHEITVDLSTNSVISDCIHTGHGYPIIMAEEQETAQALALQYAPFLAAVRKRGLKVEEALCDPFPVGWYGEDRVRNKRVVNLLCFYLDGTVNFGTMPVEGVTITVDLDEMKIVEFRDRLMVPMPKAAGTDYRESEQRPPFGVRLNEIRVEQPDGPSFEIHGHSVWWANWDFHLGFDMRAAPIISLASIYDIEQQKFRHVLYRAFVSKQFVPYMDLTEEWYSRTFFDAGEFGFGQSAVSLEPLRDCPANEKFMDAYVAGLDGKPNKKSKVISIFERHDGDIMWSHNETTIPKKRVSVIPP